MPAVKGLTLVDFCTVDSSEREITVSFDIGFGQPAFTVIMLGQKKIAEFDNLNDPPKTKIGTNKDVVGKKMRITIRVVDKNEKTDESSVGITIDGAVNQVDHKLLWKISPTGGTAQYVIDIFFRF